MFYAYYQLRWWIVELIFDLAHVTINKQSTLSKSN